MTLTGRIEDLLKEATGLDAEAIGPSTLARAITERQHATGAYGPDEYWQLLRASTTELGLLIEAVVVPETWFFRHRESFVALTDFARDECQRTQPGRTLRLLSVPCSTGEEPYSMAMALLDAGVPAGRFHVDALDISPRALCLARAGAFGKNSFRGGDLSFRTRHFTATPAGYELSEHVRARVRFAQANLLVPGPWDSRERYDVVFCRNLLIYFDRFTQMRAVAAAARLLRPGGFLFVGPSETAVVVGGGFVSTRQSMAFAFRKEMESPPEPAVAAHSPRRSIRQPPAALPVATLKHARPVPGVRPAGPPVSALPAVAPPGMEAALELAEQGRLSEAAAWCQEHVRRHGPSAQAFYLLGLVQDAGGLTREADQCYRKALYLDPHHVDALMHLALLVTQRGDQPEAQVLRTRLRRLQSRGEA